jgi:RNA polymerase sigma factor (sigma-70 family)
VVNKEQLLEDHLGLAEVIALEYSNIPRSDVNEAISEAYHALDRAVNAYEPHKGDFTPFAAKVIRNALNTLYAKQLRLAKMFPKSLDSAPIWNHAGTAESTACTGLAHKLKDSAQNIRKEVGLRESSSLLDEVMNTLSPRERRVIEGIRLGFSLSEIGQKLGISKQAVHKISAPALVKLRSHLETLGFRGIDSYGLLKSSSAGMKKMAG